MLPLCNPIIPPVVVSCVPHEQGLKKNLVEVNMVLEALTPNYSGRFNNIFKER